MPWTKPSIGGGSGGGNVTDKLNGKKIGIFGSSTSDESYIGAGVYHRVIANRTGLITSSQAKSGTKLTPATADYTVDTSFNALKQIDALPTDLDFVVGMPGANDERSAVTLGTFGSTATWDFYSALHKMCQKMFDKWPDIPLGIMATQYIGSPAAGTAVTQQTSAYHNAIAEVCAYYGIPFVDLAKEGRTPYSYLPFKNAHTRSDGLHLNDSGNLVLSNRVETFYREVLSNSVTTPAPTTPDTTAPSNVTNLAVSNLAATSLTLSWTAATDNVGVTGYEVYKDAMLLTTTTGTSYSVGGLSASTAYTFIVKAKDAAGNLSSGASVSATTAVADTTPTSVSDTFTRAADNTSPGVSDSGHVWTALQGVWGIGTNALRMVTRTSVNTGSGTRDVVVIDSGMKDVTVSAKILTTGGPTNGIVFRATDALNFMLFTVYDAATYRLYRISGGAASTVLTPNGVAPAAGDIISATCVGDSITLKINGGTSFSATDAFNNTATKHGFCSRGYEAIDMFDDFTITSA